MTDEEVYQGLINKDQRAQMALIEEYSERLIEYLLGRFQDLAEEEIEDIVLEILSKFIERPQLISLERGSIKTLLYVACVNRAKDTLRRRNSELAGFSVLNIDRLDASHLAASDISDEESLPNEVGSQFPPQVIEEARLLISDLNLSEAEWEHIRLRLLDKLPPQEIAEYSGILPNAERTRWHRLWNRIETKWQQYPALVSYAQRIGRLDRT